MNGGGGGGGAIAVALQPPSYPLHGDGGSSSTSHVSMGMKLPSAGHTALLPHPPGEQQQQQQQQQQAWGAAAKRCLAGPLQASSATRGCPGPRRRSGSPELLRCKRRLAFPAAAAAQQSGGGAAAVARRNERERNRVKLVNLGFQTLRQHVPNGAAAKKMSKVETLRSAVEYIRALQRLLDEHDAVGAAAAAAAFQDRVLRSARLPAGAAACGGGAGGGSGSGGSSYSSASPSFDGREGSSVPGSPHSAYSSDESGYEGALSPEEQELLDFTSWFGNY